MIGPSATRHESNKVMVDVAYNDETFNKHEKCSAEAV